MSTDLFRPDRKILEYKNVVSNFLSSWSKKISDWIIGVFTGIFDKINIFLMGIPEKILNYIDSIINWINTKATEFFLNFIEPVIFIFLDLIVNLFKGIGVKLLALPGSFVTGAMDKVVPDIIKNAIDLVPGWGYNSLKRSIKNAANSPLSPIIKIVKDIPSLLED